MVFKGNAVVSGVGRAVVTATGMSTEMGTIATLLDETEQEPSPLQVEIAQISRTLGLLVVGIVAGWAHEAGAAPGGDRSGAGAPRGGPAAVR